MKCGTCYHSCHHSVIFQSVRKVSSFTVAVMPYKFSKSSHYPKLPAHKLPCCYSPWQPQVIAMTLHHDCMVECFCATCTKDLWTKIWKKATTTLQLHGAHPDYWSTKKCFKCWYELSLHVLYGEKKLLNTTGISKGASSGNLDLGLERKTSSTGLIVLHPTG